MTRPPEQRLLTEANADPVVTAHATTEGTALNGALNATYARFVDENGNPLASRHVVIKVDSTSGEILDIVSEV